MSFKSLFLNVLNETMFDLFRCLKQNVYIYCIYIIYILYGKRMRLVFSGVGNFLHIRGPCFFNFLLFRDALKIKINVIKNSTFNILKPLRDSKEGFHVHRL